MFLPPVTSYSSQKENEFRRDLPSLLRSRKSFITDEQKTVQEGVEVEGKQVDVTFERKRTRVTSW